MEVFIIIIIVLSIMSGWAWARSLKNLKSKLKLQYEKEVQNLEDFRRKSREEVVRLKQELSYFQKLSSSSNLYSPDFLEDVLGKLPPPREVLCLLKTNSEVRLTSFISVPLDSTFEPLSVESSKSVSAEVVEIFGTKLTNGENVIKVLKGDKVVLVIPIVEKKTPTFNCFVYSLPSCNLIDEGDITSLRGMYIGLSNLF